MMKTPLILNAIVLAFFVGLLAYTTVARQHLMSLAGDFAMQKTVQHDEDIVTVGNAIVEGVDDRGWLTGAQKLLTQRELAEFRDDPYGFLSSATKKPPLKIPGLEKLQGAVSIKKELRTYFDSLVSSLLSDVRVFAGTNAFAGAFGVGLCLFFRRSSSIQSYCFSYALCVAVAFGCCLFLDHLSFFTILFQLRMGWFYPVCVAAFCVWLYTSMAAAVESVTIRSAITPLDFEQTK